MMVLEPKHVATVLVFLCVKILYKCISWCNNWVMRYPMLWKRDIINSRFLDLPEHRFKSQAAITLNRPVTKLGITQNINKNMHIMANIKS